MIFISPHQARRAISGLCISSIALTLSACGGSGSTMPETQPSLSNQLYTQTNETANMVVHMVRAADGSITIKNRTASGGAGLNGIKPGATTAVPDSLVSQFSVLVSPDHTLLFAVNGGDSSVSVFSIDQTSGDVTLKKATKTLGATPSSLAFNNGVLYVSFQSGTGQLGAYAVKADGALEQLGLYALPASGNTPTQVIVSPDANYVVVSAGTASNAIVSYPINKDGTLGAPTNSTSGINSPFAGSFASASVYLESDVAGKGLASYTFSNTGSLSLIGEIITGEGAPCWLSITPDGKFAFVGNGVGTISSFSIDASGTLKLLNAKAAQEVNAIAGVPGVAGDSWISPDGKFLYSTYLGDDKVVAYSIDAAGALTKLNEQIIGTESKLSLHGMSGI